MKNPTPLVIATRNEGKLSEIRQLLADLPLRIVSLSDFPSVREVPETGKTFAENACLKATGYALQTNRVTLADDSGLEVDALGGTPGIFSARYAGERATDSERIDRLLADLSNAKDANRRARFVASIAIANADGTIVNISEGRCEGIIATSPHGDYGFGYDPVFVPDGYQRSFAELGPSIKNEISHRAKALKQTRKFLISLTDSFGAS
jgi:XTP/dITP diphosphohydrolase